MVNSKLFRRFMQGGDGNSQISVAFAKAVYHFLFAGGIFLGYLVAQVEKRTHSGGLDLHQLVL